MKTPAQLFITTFFMAALLFTRTTVAQTAPPTGGRMKAVVYHSYGSPDVLRLEEMAKPVPNDNQLLVRVRAVSINPLDWHYMEGTPYIVRLLDSGLIKPKVTRLGVDYAGTVEAVGKTVTQFKPGDEVFGGKTGAFAEYVCVLADRAVALKPANVTFEQAASVPIAGITALQALRDKGKVHPGDKVLINGASGGVGTFAVQIAKTFGADVTGVCSTRNVDLVRSLGADHVIDYTKEDFTRNGQRYDVIVDNVTNHSVLESTRALNPRGKYVIIGGGGTSEQGFIGPLANPIKALLVAPFVSQQVGMMLAELNHNDLAALGDLMQAGKVTPVIDRTYPLSEMPDAMRYLEGGHARGKVAVTIDNAATSLNRAAGSRDGGGSVLIGLTLVGGIVGMTIVPIVVALTLNRRFQRRHPGTRPYRWGYYFSIISALIAAALALMLVPAVVAIVVCLIYAVLAWFFARRRRWAWIALTVLSFNPVAWIINSIYLRKRSAEDLADGAPVAA
jgi:NADPH:quinone reductase-like Zn-dependent oxidoreductase